MSCKKLIELSEDFKFKGTKNTRENLKIIIIKLKGALSGLRHILTTEGPLKIMKNAFYFTSKALFVIKIFKFLSWFFGHVSK